MMKKMMKITRPKTKTKTKTIVIATAITTLLSATAAFAMKVFPRSDSIKDDLKKEDNNGFNTILDGLVKAGTITQAQEDAIRGGFDNVLDGLVKSGTITQDQEAAI